MNYYFLKAKSTGLLILTSASINLMLCAIASAQSEPTQILDTNLQNNKPQSSNIVNNFEVNITNQQIVKQNYQASTSISVGEAARNGISLRVGAAVQASSINMQLQNIHGQVRFRAKPRLQSTVLDHPTKININN